MVRLYLRYSGFTFDLFTPVALGDRHLASRGGRQSKDVRNARGGGSDPPSKKFTPLGGGVV